MVRRVAAVKGIALKVTLCVCCVEGLHQCNQAKSSVSLETAAGATTNANPQGWIIDQPYVKATSIEWICRGFVDYELEDRGVAPRSILS
jgi:hypothetical protein